MSWETKEDGFLQSDYPKMESRFRINKIANHPNVSCTDRLMALHWAAGNRHKAVVRLLLDHKGMSTQRVEVD
jgi:hypothetical protein